MRIGKKDLTIMSMLAGAAMVALPVVAAQPQAPFSYMYTLMVNVVGPAGNSVTERLAFKTLEDDDWRQLKQDVRKLMGSINQVAFGGTSAAEEQRAKSNEWQRWAGKLSETASAAERAIDQEDRVALTAAGNNLVETCEGCHRAFPIGIH